MRINHQEALRGKVQTPDAHLFLTRANTARALLPGCRSRRAALPLTPRPAGALKALPAGDGEVTARAAGGKCPTTGPDSLAAGLAAQAVLFLQQADIVTALSQTAWDTSAILSDTSLFGRVLHTLMGYADQPSQLQVLVYAGTLAVIITLTRWTRVQAPAAAPAH